MFHGARTRADVPYIDELAALGEAGALSCRVASSREDQRLVLRGGELVGEPAARGYVDTLLEDPAVIEALGGLLDEACIYVCGQSAFAHTALEGVQRLLARTSNDEATAQLRFRRLVADGRLMMDIFTTFAPATAPGVLGRGVFDASEVARHNNAALGYWMTISGFVYDMTEFLHLHPGGDKLIIAYAGSDATRAYRKVEHHLNSEVDAMLDMYKIGRIRRLDFLSRRGVAPDLDGKLRAVDFRDAFRHWMRYLFEVIECENTMTNEWSLRGRDLLGGDAPSALTPYKLNLLLQVHQRLSGDYMDHLLGDRLHHLWLLTAGMFAQDEGMQTMKQRVARCRGSAAAETASALRQRMAHLPKAPDFAERADPIAHLVEHLRLMDARVMRRIKESICAGVAVFEQHEARVDAQGAALVEALLGVPAAVEDWHAEFVERCGPPISASDA